MINSNAMTAYDLCDWNDPRILIERYCQGAEPRFSKVYCNKTYIGNETCYDGACPR